MRTGLLTSAVLLVAAAGGQAQLDEPKDLEILGRAAAQQRAVGSLERTATTAAKPDAYPQTLTFRDGHELHGLFLYHADDEIFWHRADASEVLRFPRSEVVSRLMVRLVPNELDGPRVQPRRPKSRRALEKSAAPDLLIFKDGDELAGQMLASTTSGPLRWRTAYGQEVDFQIEHIAGIRVGNRATTNEPRSDVESEAMVELRTGERLRGKLLALDEKQLRLELAQIGPVTVDRAQVWRLYPHAQLGAIDGGSSADWKWTGEESRKSADEVPGAEAGHRIHLDGIYAQRSSPQPSSTPISKVPGWQHSIDPRLERFEVRFEIARDEQRLSGQPYATLLGSGMALCFISDPSEIEWAVARPAGNAEVKWHRISLEKLDRPNAPRTLRLCVDTKKGSCDLFINGESVAHIGRDESERLEKMAYAIRLQPNHASPIFSNIWIGPWSGELPTSTEPPALTSLRNGDVIPGTPSGWRAGKWQFAGDLSDLEVPAEKVLIVDFGGTMQARPAAGRVRLGDGSSLDVDTFQWDGHTLTAQSAALGPVQVEAGALSELIFHPAPLQPPPPAKMRKTARQEALRPAGG